MFPEGDGSATGTGGAGSGSGAANAGGAGGQGQGTGQGAGAPPPTDWRASLTGEFEPLRAEASLSVIKGKDWNEAGPQLAKVVANQSKLVGSSIRLPGKDAKPEEIQAFREKLGVPKDVTGYGEVKLANMEGVPDFDQKVINDFAKPAFLKIGLTPQQAQDVLTLFGDYTARQYRQAADVYLEGQDVLETKWGLAFERNVGLAQRALQKYASPGLLKLLRSTQLDMHPDFITMFHEIGHQIAEDGIIDGSGPGEPTSDDIEKEIIELRGKIAKTAEGSQDRKTMETRLEQLYRARWPEPVGGR